MEKRIDKSYWASEISRLCALYASKVVDKGVLFNAQELVEAVVAVQRVDDKLARTAFGLSVDCLYTPLTPTDDTDEDDEDDEDLDTIYEHWVVNDNLAKQLKLVGETVFDIVGMKVWGRTTTGSALHNDSCFQKIAPAWCAFEHVTYPTTFLSRKMLTHFLSETSFADLDQQITPSLRALAGSNVRVFLHNLLSQMKKESEG